MDDKTGTYSVEAEFVKVEGQNVHLKLKDGNLKVVPLSRLSATDRDYLESLKRPAANNANSDTGQVQSLDQSKLAKPIALQIDQIPLRDLPQELAKAAGLPVLLRSKGISDAGAIVPATSIKELPLEEALNQILAPLQLAWTIHDGVIVIAGVEDVLLSDQLRVYQLARGIDSENLIADITNKIEPMTWEDVGGPSAIIPYGPYILVRSSRSAHRQIESEYKTKLKPAAPAKEPFQPRGIDQETWQALNTVVEPPLEQHLASLVASVYEQTNIKIEIDEPALMEAGIPLNVELLAHAGKIRVITLLELSLQDLNLACTLSNKDLTITTMDRAQEQLVKSVFEVQDVFVRDPLSGGGVDLVIFAIVSLIRPETWEENGGFASIEALATGRASLEIHQTLANQFRVAQLLAELKSAKASR